jgi:hypothetical protein
MSSSIGNTTKTKVEVYADIADPKGRASKDTDVLVYAGISKKPGDDNKDQLTFKGASNNSAFTKLRNFLNGRHTARDRDVYLILRTHGMSDQAARAATIRIKHASTGLGGYSAKATQQEIASIRANIEIGNVYKEVKNNSSNKVP